MKKIPLQEALEILQSSRAIVIDNETVVFGCVENGEEEGRIFCSNWTDDDYHEFDLQIYSDANETVQVDDTGLIFIDENGEEVKLTPLFEKSLD